MLDSNQAASVFRMREAERMDACGTVLPVTSSQAIYP